MIQFPETAATEWKIIADAAQATTSLRQRLERDTLVERAVETLRIRHEANLLFQNELDADLTPVLEMSTLSSFKANPTAGPTDLIEGVIKDNSLCIMMGPSGSGKSTLALQITYCLMTGTPFLGQPVQQISGAAGVLSYDMDGSLTMDWMSGFPGVDPDKVSVVNAHKRGNPLGVAALRAQIADAWKAMGVEVVVLDSFGASFFAHDQNDAATTMAHYRDMMLFALTEVGAKTLIVIAHSTEGSPHKARGSSVHHDVADSIVSVAEDPNGKRGVRMVKYRQHRLASGTMSTQMTPVVIGAPDDVTHLVDLDLGAMTLAGLSLPPGSAAAAFTALPEPTEAPDTDSDEREEDEDL